MTGIEIVSENAMSGRRNSNQKTEPAVGCAAFAEMLEPAVRCPAIAEVLDRAIGDQESHNLHKKRWRNKSVLIITVMLRYIRVVLVGDMVAWFMVYSRAL